MQQDDLAKNYIGLKVDWSLKFRNARKSKNDSVKVFLEYGDRLFPEISCEVNLSKYRELGVMKEGADIRVLGTIDNFEHGTILLKDVTLLY